VVFAGVSVGVDVRHEAVPVVVGEGGPGGVSASHGDAGQDLVPEQEEQVEAPVGRRHGGRQHGQYG